MWLIKIYDEVFRVGTWYRSASDLPENVLHSVTYNIPEDYTKMGRSGHERFQENHFYLLHVGKRRAYYQKRLQAKNNNNCNHRAWSRHSLMDDYEKITFQHAHFKRIPTQTDRHRRISIIERTLTRDNTLHSLDSIDIEGPIDNTSTKVIQEALMRQLGRYLVI